MRFAADKGTFLAFSAENGEQAIARKRTLPEVTDGWGWKGGRGGGRGIILQENNFPSRDGLLAVFSSGKESF